jgi:hypothetical protein
MLERTERPLTPEETARLRLELAQRTAESNAALRRALLIAAAVCAMLCIITLLASDAAWYVAVAVWTLLALGISAWVGLDLRHNLRRHAGQLQAVLAHNTARSTSVKASAVAEFEEFEDEGACWAFQVEPELLLFVCGQAYYATADFPSNEFTIVEPLLPGGSAADEWLDVHGPRLEPVRNIPAAVKLRLDLPAQLETVRGTLAELETVLHGSL